MSTDIRSRSRRRQGGLAFAFISPFILLFLAAFIAPLVYAVVLSVYAEKRSGLGFGGSTREFVGIDNFVSVFTDPTFLNSFTKLTSYFIFYVPIMLGAALCLALLLDAATTLFKKTFQLLLFLPHAVPGVIAAIIWSYLYTPSVSPIVSALETGGISINFLSAEWVLPSIINIAVWEWTGYNVIILFTALQSISGDVIEASRIDGASGWKIAWAIKTPIIRPAFGLILLFTVIGSLQLFSEPLVLRQATTSVNSTFVPNMWAYNAAFSRHDLGQAAAASIFIAVLAAVLSFGVTQWSNRKEKA